MFKDGLPMGGLLSSLMADVFMDHLEIEILRTAPNVQHVLGWYLFMDDILCVWSGSSTELRRFLVSLNPFHTQISFTHEKGVSYINLLDLTINLTPSPSLFPPSLPLLSSLVCSSSFLGARSLLLYHVSLPLFLYSPFLIVSDLFHLP